MKLLLSSLCCLLLNLQAHATLIIPVEDDADRFVFDIGWSGPWMHQILFGDGIYTSPGGTRFNILQPSANELFHVVEVYRPNQPVVIFGVLFQGHVPEGVDNPPDPIFGTSTGPYIGLPADHVTAVPGNDHAARILIGSPVPDTGSTALLLLLALAILMRNLPNADCGLRIRS